jgi:hypothetical protein
MWWRIAAHAALCSGVILGSGQARAWGPEGHAIVAEIAEARLDGPARAQIVQLLSQEGHQHLDEIASWADDYRESHRETGPWHYVNIPLSASGYDASRDCNDGACVVAQIQHFAAVLGDKTAAPSARLTALKFVVHFVGDIHQPLHCEDNGDRGGNDVHLTYFDKPTNLHAVWDGGVIEQALGVTLGPHYAPNLTVTQKEATLLGRNVSPTQAATWAPSGLASRLDAATMEWANESHALAQIAYRELPSSPRPQGWDGTYQGEAWPVIQDQLNRAGVRLGRTVERGVTVKVRINPHRQG